MHTQRVVARVRCGLMPVFNAELLNPRRNARYLLLLLLSISPNGYYVSKNANLPPSSRRPGSGTHGYSDPLLFTEIVVFQTGIPGRT